jgi:hypothetical protein
VCGWNLDEVLQRTRELFDGSFGSAYLALSRILGVEAASAQIVAVGAKELGIRIAATLTRCHRSSYYDATFVRGSGK